MFQRLRFLLVFIFVLAACTRNPAVPLAPMPTASSSLRTETITIDEAEPTVAEPVEAKAVPDFLAWELDGGFSLDNFPPDQPFAIRFNQPMSIATPQPLIFSPSVRGETKWSENNTLLTFTPEAGFTIDRRYSVNLHASLRSNSGLQFTAVQRLQLHTQTAPKVRRRTPSSGIVSDYQPTFALTLSEPMDHASVEAAFSMSPALPYSMTWDGYRFKVAMDAPLQFDTEYQFTLDKTAVDENGRHLVQPYTWTAQLAEPLARVSWPTANNHLAPIVVQFNYPIDHASLSDALDIKPAISGKLSWSGDHTTVELMPDSQLPANTAYTISFNNALLDQDGNPLPVPEASSFTTPHAILSATPTGLGNHPADSIKIRFDRLMDTASTEAAFHIEPPTNGRFRWQETSLIFTPEEGYLAETTEYTVTIAQTALSADGIAVLNDDYTWDFATKVLADIADFGYGPNAQVLAVNGRRAVQFQAFRRDSLSYTFELYQLDLSQFLDRYESGFHGWIWRDEDETTLQTEDAELVAEWELVSGTPLQEWANVQEAIIPENVPPGLYILNLVAGNVNDQLLLVISQNNIAVKQADDQLLAWVTDINGASVPNTAVSIYARNGSVITSGQTDDDGLYEASLPPFSEGGPPATEPLMVMAQVGDDITVTGLSGEWQNGAGFYDRQSRSLVGANSAAFVFTERPIYKPGQTVYFKAIVRLDEDALLSVPSVGTAVTVRIRDARSNVVQTQELLSNSFGSVNGSFLIAEGASLGNYSITVSLNGTEHKQIFKVEDYRKPDYEVTVTTDSTVYVKGETAEITVDTAYFFGEPVANANITLRRFQVTQDWYTPEVTTWYQLYGSHDLHGKTDENGRFTFELPLRGNALYFNQSNWRSSQEFVMWGLEATVDDGSHQTVSGHAIITIYDAIESVTVDTGGYVQEPERPFTIKTTVQDIYGNPVANRQLELSLRRWNHGGYELVVQSANLTTNENGRADLNFTIDQPGYYQIRVAGQDSRGNSISYKSWVYAFSDFHSGWYGRNDGDLQIAADQIEYAPGDVAHLLVESSFSGPALLTVERGTVRRQQLILLTAPVTRLPLLIEDGDMPNVYVAINAWQEQGTVPNENTSTNLPDSRLHTAYVNLSVPAFNKRLNVTITPDKAEYVPGEEATFTVRVTNYLGEPVSAEVSLALVDEAIFALSPELNGLMYDDFYYDRASTVRTYNSMNPIRHLWQGGMGGGGGDGGVETGGPRQDFPDTAVWQPNLYTNFNGEVSVTVTLPDSLTSWRATAKAATADTQVGEATANVITKQDVIIRPLLPRILTTGDRMALSAIVHNFSDETLELDVELTIDDTSASLSTSFGLTIGNEPVQTVTLQAGEQQVVGWSVEAVAAGEVDVLITAVSPNSGPSDAIQIPLTIQPLSIPDVTTEVGQFSGQYQTTLAVPQDALPLSQVEVQISRSIAGSMLEGLQYLTGYPYGCVEQTMSKALPNAVVGRALNQLGVTNPTLQAELPGQINASIQRLYGFQHTDGGWGWWFDDASHDYQTAWVIFGLAQVADAGYEIDPAVIERGVNWLNDEREMDARTRAFALYAMAVAGLPNEEATLALAENHAHLNGDEFSLAALALTLHEMGEDGLAAEILEELGETAVSDNNFIYWTGSRQDGYYRNKVMASDVRTTAMALSAYSQIQPTSDLIPGISRWLMSQRSSHGWGTTNETSFAILGLTDHLLATSYSETASSTGYTVQVNGQTVASGTLGRGEPAVTLTIPMEQLEVGENELTLSEDGGRVLYFVVNGRMLVPRTQIEAAGDVIVTRRYLDGETGQPLESIAPGQLVQIRLTVDLPSSGSYIIIEDSLPGGLEALNEGLSTTSHVADAYNGPVYRWRELGYNYKEIRGDRVSFFITEMSSSVRTLTYFARATQAGSFTAMPTEVYAMYDLSLWGRSASNQIMIESPE